MVNCEFQWFLFPFTVIKKWLYKSTPGFGYKTSNLPHLEALHNNLLKIWLICFAWKSWHGLPENNFTILAHGLRSSHFDEVAEQRGEQKKHELKISSLRFSVGFGPSCCRFGRGKDFHANHCLISFIPSHIDGHFEVPPNQTFCAFFNASPPLRPQPLLYQGAWILT